MQEESYNRTNAPEAKISSGLGNAAYQKSEIVNPETKMRQAPA